MADSIVRNSDPTADIEDILFIDSAYTAGYDVDHIIHPKMNGEGYNITYRTVRDRAGNLPLFFETSAQAWAAIELLRTPYTFTLTADVAAVSMTFVVAPGRLTPRPVVVGEADAWSVSVPYQEVTP